MPNFNPSVFAARDYPGVVEKVADESEGLGKVKDQVSVAPVEEVKETPPKKAELPLPNPDEPDSGEEDAVPHKITGYNLVPCMPSTPRLPQEEMQHRMSSKTVHVQGAQNEEKMSTFFERVNETGGFSKDASEVDAEAAARPINVPPVDSSSPPEQMLSSPESAGEEWWNRIVNTFYQTWKDSPLFAVWEHQMKSVGGDEEVLHERL